MLDIPSILIVIGLVLLLGHLSRVQQRKRQTSLEPPLVSSTIPVVGHLIAFAYYGLEYFPLQR